MIPLAKRLRQRVRLEHAVTVKDAHGGSVTSWAEFHTVRAEVGASVGRSARQTSHGGIEDIASVAIRIRYLAGVDSSMRLVYGQEVFAIDHVDNERQANHTMLLTCRSVPVGAR